MKISHKISLSFFIVALILTGFSTYLAYKVTKKTILERINYQLLTTVTSRAHHIETFLKEDKSRVKIMAESREIKSYLKEIIRNRQEPDKFIAKINISLKSFIKAEDETYEIFILSPDGKVIASTNESNIGDNKSKDNYFLGALKGAYIKDVYYSQTTGKRGYAVSAPIRDDNTKEILGVLVARLEMTGLNGITAERTGLGKTGKIYLINKDSYMITESRFMDDTFLRIKVDTENARNCFQFKEGEEHVHDIGDVTIAPDYRGVSVLGTHNYIEEMGWALLAEIDVKEALAPLDKIRKFFIILFISIPLIAFLIGAYISELISRPIKRLYKGTEIIGNGNLDYKVGIDTRDEIGDLSRTFDQMTDNLKTITASRDELNKEIKDRKKAEQELIKAGEEWENTFNSITDFVSVHDNNFKIVKVNKAFADFLGSKPEELIGRYCYEVVHNLKEPIIDCPYVETMKSKKTETKEIYEPNIGLNLLITTSPIFDDSGNIKGVVHFAKDITEQKKLKDQLRHSQKLETVGQLAGGVAHDFNNVLAAIINYGHVLLMKPASEEQKQTIEKILSSADRAAKLTASLLAFSRKQIMQPMSVKINEIIKRVEKLILRVIGEVIEIRTVLTDKDSTVMADSAQIEQVLMNLATNARDAMPEGGTLTIETEEIEMDDEYVKTHGYGKPGRYVLLSVTDTGVGMDEETREKVFEPFFTTKEAGKGTGLGLAMIYGIIKQHNGFINVYSEPGMGTTFKIYLPVIGEGVEETMPSVSKAITKGTETLLLAEDDADLREVTRQILEESGYSVIETVDGEDAVEKFRENKDRIQLLILDAVMPRKGGKMAYDEIKKDSPKIKALFMSGYTAETVGKNGILEEGLNFISKPVAPTELLRKIREVLDK